MKKEILLIMLVASVNILCSQNNANTPYSIFGLGVENKTATGGLTGLGNTGIAQSSPFEINIFNPASLGNILQKSFLYEFGLNGTYSTLKTTSTTENSSNGNISHIAIAFPIRKDLGMSIGLLPYTKTGYNIDIENPIKLQSFALTPGLSKRLGLKRKPSLFQPDFIIKAVIFHYRLYRCQNVTNVFNNADDTIYLTSGPSQHYNSYLL